MRNELFPIFEWIPWKNSIFETFWNNGSGPNDESDVDDNVLLVTVWSCWWQNYFVGEFYGNYDDKKYKNRSPTSVIWVTSMLVTDVGDGCWWRMLVMDVGDEMYCWQLLDVGDGFGHIVTNIHFLSSLPSGANIQKMSPTSDFCLLKSSTSKCH